MYVEGDFGMGEQNHDFMTNVFESSSHCFRSIASATLFHIQALLQLLCWRVENNLTALKVMLGLWQKS